MRILFLVMLLSLPLGRCAESGPPAREDRIVRVETTAGGVRFGLLGEPRQLPAPTLFVFASTIDTTLGGGNGGYYLQAGSHLLDRGYLCVSVDLPCHGGERRPGESEGLRGWRERFDRKEPFLKKLNGRLSAVLDHLIAAGLSNPDRVAACGVSRGGFVALHWAARDKRIRAVAGFAPVTDLAALSEFAGAADQSVLRAASVSQVADQLAGRPVWLAIGDRDVRVDTDRTIAFARAVSHASYAQDVDSHVELHVLPEPRGHTMPIDAFETAANWIERQIPR
ncbi:MAG: alpha/beta hydrolase family protein [Pirellulales bacterium]